MWRIIKFLLYLLVFGFIGLLLFAYFGPFLGVDFSAPSQAVQLPVDLNAEN